MEMEESFLQAVTDAVRREILESLHCCIPGNILVYDPETGKKDRVHKMLRDNRIRYFAPADYREGTELDNLVKAVIDKTAAYEKLETKHISDVYETR